MKKKACTLAIAALLALTSSSATSLIVDGSTVKTDVLPVIVEGRTLVPVRALFESLGASVEWNEATQTVTAKKDSTVISMQIGSTTAYVDGVSKTLDVPAQTINNRTMAPARFVAESLGGRVFWDESTDTVKILTIPGVTFDENLVYYQDISTSGKGSLTQQYVDQFNKDHPVSVVSNEWVSLGEVQQAGASFNILLYEDYVIQKGFRNYKMPSLPDDFIKNPQSGTYDGIRIEVQDGTLYFNQSDLLKCGVITAPIVQYVVSQ